MGMSFGYSQLMHFTENIVSICYYHFGQYSGSDTTGDTKQFTSLRIFGGTKHSNMLGVKLVATEMSRASPISASSWLHSLDFNEAAVLYSNANA